MPTRAPLPPDILVTVDGAEFYALVRANKRRFSARAVGHVTLTTRDGYLLVETARGASFLPCEPAPPLTARMMPGDFFQLASLANDAKTIGPLTLTFRPALGEIALPHAGVKAVFEKPPA